MANATTTFNRATIEPLPDNIQSAQPGGGVCYRLELAWGVLRRRYLRRYCPGYVERMRRLRRGDTAGCPHEVLDPRDLKYHRNQCRCVWDETDDPFGWRGRLGLARWGLAELQLLGYPLALVAVATAARGWWVWPLPALLAGLLVYFFRDPARRIPREAGVVVAPADGKIVEITRLAHDEYLAAPAIRIGIFLSIFDVHINRAPVRARVVGLRYQPGKFLNALRPASTVENESMWIALEEDEPPHRRFAVRQISGQIARRIVCDLAPAQLVERGEKFGMIKLGSRTELILAESDDLRIEVALRQRVKAGATVVARYALAES